MGLGGIALSSLLGRESRAASASPHFPAKAKHVIFLHMSGGPSHVDLFDPKPALNKCEPFSDPQTGGTQHFITTNLRHPNDPQAGFNGAYFLLRRSASQYEWCEIPGLGVPAGQQLRGIRTVETSPFADEPRTYYFGGYSSGLEKVSNTAWIFKGVYRTPYEMEMPTLALAPITPGALQLRTGLTQPGFSYQLETSTTLTNWVNFGAPFPGNGSVFATNLSTSGETHRFFRLRQTQP